MNWQTKMDPGHCSAIHCSSLTVYHQTSSTGASGKSPPSWSTKSQQDCHNLFPMLNPIHSPQPSSPVRFTPLTLFRIPQVSWIGPNHTRLEPLGLSLSHRNPWPALQSEQPSLASET